MAIPAIITLNNIIIDTISYQCKLYFTSVFIQVIDLYKKSENNLHETLIIKSKKVIYITQKKGDILSPL